MNTALEYILTGMAFVFWILILEILGGLVILDNPKIKVKYQDYYADGIWYTFVIIVGLGVLAGGLAVISAFFLR